VTGYRHDDLDPRVVTDDGIVTAEELWDNLTYLQRAIVPAADEAGVKLALHPDDPPQPVIQHIARILISADAMERATRLCPGANAGITMCQATFAMMGEKVIDCIHRFGKQNRINLVHFRDVCGNRDDFHETFHDNGMTDMAACIRADLECGYDGYIRVDPGDFIFGDNDGVVIVPKKETVRVLEQAEEWFQNEKKSRQAMAEGIDPFTVYNTYGRF